MRFFASSHRIDQLAPRTRWLLLGLLGFLALQIASGVAMHDAGPGWTSASIATHYGAELVDDGELAAPPAMDDPFAAVAPPPPPPAVDLTSSSLMETAHIHLAIMPLVVFTIAHVFAMTGLGRRPGVGWLAGLTYLAVLGDIGIPFLVRSFGEAWAMPKLIAFLLLIGGMAFMLLWSAVVTLRSLLRPAGGAPTAS